MRKIISLLLTVIMVLTAIPVSFAQESTEPKMSLEKAIELAKSKLKVPEKDFNFNSNYTENNDGKNLWFLNWNSKVQSQKSFDTSVTINADTGDIVSYSSYTEKKNVSRIPKYTIEQAKKAAEEFISNIDAEKFKETKLFEKQYLSGNEYLSDTYSFSYVRYIGDIPYIDNYFNIFIDKSTLNVTSFQLEWDSDIISLQKANITIDQAKEIFKDKLGVELSYKLVSDNGDYTNPKAILVYSLKYGNKPIDAKTGEILKDGYYYANGEGYYRKNMNKAKEDQKAQLTPEEQKAVDKTKKYIKKELALEIAKKYLNLESGYTLTNSNLYDDYLGMQDAVWSFYWEYKAPQNSKVKVASERYGSQSCSVDAVTGEVRSFYISDSKFEAPKDAKMKYNKETAKKLADAFIKKILPQKSKDFEFRDYDLYNQSYDNSTPKYFYFNYVRKQGNAYCPFNKVNITVDAYNGIIN
ncbi:MAG: YcdB/YcdC domain-containing protein, partial [Ignavibacteriales bacterium]